MLLANMPGQPRTMAFEWLMKPPRTKSMNMTKHAGSWRHDAEHADDEYDSDSKGNFDQRVT
jgi:hypothetical protein